jgi:hypothetical protein
VRAAAAVQRTPARDGPPDGLGVGNANERVRIEQHDIRQLARLQATQKISRSHPLGTALSRDAQDLDRWDARSREILEFGVQRLAVGFSSKVSYWNDGGEGR